MCCHMGGKVRNNDLNTCLIRGSSVSLTTHYLESSYKETTKYRLQMSSNNYQMVTSVSSCPDCETEIAVHDFTWFEEDAKPEGVLN